MKILTYNNIDNLIENLNKELKAVISTEVLNLMLQVLALETRVLTTRLIHIINQKKHGLIKFYASHLLIKKLGKCKTELCNM